jgi:hypothetical protein
MWEGGRRLPAWIEMRIEGRGGALCASTGTEPYARAEGALCASGGSEPCARAEGRSPVREHRVCRHGETVSLKRSTFTRSQFSTFHFRGARRADATGAPADRRYHTEIGTTLLQEGLERRGDELGVVDVGGDATEEGFEFRFGEDDLKEFGFGEQAVVDRCGAGADEAIFVAGCDDGADFDRGADHRGAAVLDVDAAAHPFFVVFKEGDEHATAGEFEVVHHPPGRVDGVDELPIEVRRHLGRDEDGEFFGVAGREAGFHVLAFESRRVAAGTRAARKIIGPFR